MRIAYWAGAILILVAVAANAQRADCPVSNAPLPMRPPGKPPDGMPQVTFPDKFDGAVKSVMPPVQPASEELVDAEEGHVTAVARMVQMARAAPPAPDVLRGAVDPRNTRLSEWKFEGYIREFQPHKVTRVFSRGGSVLVFEQWNYTADGGGIYPTRSPSTMVGKFPARLGGLRTPSGCVSATLSWEADGTGYALRVAGPLSLKEQRELLKQVAQSIDSAITSRK